MRIRSLIPAASLAAACLSGTTVSAQRGSRRPVELTLTQVVDSARLTDAVRQLPALPASGASVYVLAYDSTGAVAARVLGMLDRSGRTGAHRRMISAL